MMVTIFFLIIGNFKFSNEFNIDLILSLQENFHSDVILFAKNFKNEKTIKKILEYQESQPKAFVGLIDLDNSRKIIMNPVSIRHKNKLVIFDNESNFIRKLIEMQEIDSNLMTSFIWIYFMETDDGTQNLDLLNIPFDSKFFLVKEINFSKFEVIDVYQITSSSPKIYTRYAVWENKELKLFKENLSYSRKNLKGYEMKVAGTPVAESLRKHFPFWDLLSNSMNFTLKRNWVKSVGFLFKNGTKTYVFKLVYEGMMEGGSNLYSLSNERMDDFDFIIPIVISQAKLYVGIKQGLNWKAYITPFEIHIWISVIVWSILACFLMHITNRIISPVIKYRFEDPIFNFIRAFCNQGRTIRERKILFYIPYLMPYVLGMVLLQYYSADLLSHLTVKDSTPPFRNLKGVVEDGTYEIACFYPSPLWQELSAYYARKDVKPGKLVPIYEKALASGDFFHDLCKHRRVVIMGTYEFNMKVNCKVVELPESVYSRTFGIMMQKYYPYRQIMTKLVKRFQIIGLSKLYQKNIVKEWESDHVINPVELTIVFPAFLLLLSFVCLSVIILSLEMIVWKFQKRGGTSRRRITSAKIEFSKP